MTAHALDHVALAVRSWAQAGPVLAGRYGGRWDSGFAQPVFSPAQLQYADGMRVELLEPGDEPSSFVRRYLDATGAPARPHHITFKVHDIRATLDAARAGGFEPILVNLESEWWQEGFLHPKQTGLGFLVQVAQSAGTPKDLAGDLPGMHLTPPWPEPAGPYASLPAVAGRVADQDLARRVLCDVLGGIETPLEAGTSSYAWPGGADLVLTATREHPPELRLLAFRGDGATSWKAGDVLSAAEREPVVPELGIRTADLAASGA
ncbi:VOC family protein [Actinomadura sp. ATCC 31491]|uniref:VOC family protein n=1 Tax=Actinomadura luzonensis TaxID=2805427 RepID=A0ABT0G1Y3_9ACTN|nr:VOC family protein [Actinomadura luzonensis]MCK2218622.1 VOC family protein [Actinomadura luzonensis]